MSPDQPLPPVDVVGPEPAEPSSVATALAFVLFVVGLTALACAPAVVAFVWRWAL